MTSNLGIGKLRDMQNDIKNLRSKVADYYAQYDDIPVRKDIEYTNIGHLRSAGIISDAVDTGKFYVIELSSLDNLTLTYGQEYQQLKNGSVTDPNTLKDIYIINEASHNIFYVQGIELDDEWFYTDYTSDQIDTQTVEGHIVDGVIIPDGFYYVGGTKEEGIVISDVPNDDMNNTAQGNQFVWVPVGDYSKFQRQLDYFEGETDAEYFADCGEADSTGTNSKVTETNTTKAESIAMYDSVKTYGGFYIGRFETGKDENENVVIRKGVTPYNNVPWSVTASMAEDEDIDGTENGAIEQARYFYTLKGYTGVTSTLCYSVQWDATMNFIDPNYITNAEIGAPNCAEDSFVRDSTDKGWYGQSQSTNTGYYQIKNIYDLAGNVDEWTMESYYTDRRVGRGGNYDDSGFEYPSSIRSSIDLDAASPDIGFRICLFINVPEEENEQVGVVNEFLRKYYLGETDFEGDFTVYFSDYRSYLVTLRGDDSKGLAEYDRMNGLYGSELDHMGTISLLLSDYRYSQKGEMFFTGKLDSVDRTNQLLNISETIQGATYFQEFAEQKIKELDSPEKEAEYAEELLNKGAIPNNKLTLLDLYIYEMLQ